MGVIGIDYGTKRVGIAISESMELATPHSVLRNPGSDERLAGQLARLGEELSAELFILGIPRGGRHDALRIQARYEQLAELVRQASGIDVVLWDESHSSAEAAALREERGVRRRSGRDESIDREAAAVILQSWLDHRRRSS